MAEDKADGWLTAPIPAGRPSEIDTSVAHPARVYDYWLGGKVHPRQAEAQRRYNERVSTPQTLRTRAEVSRFFGGLDLVPPGLVYVHAWRPGPDDIVPPNGVSAYGGVARKP